MFNKMGDENYKMIVDNGSSINAISSKVIKRFGLKVVSHPHPYKVSWINSMTLEVSNNVLSRSTLIFTKIRSGVMWLT